MKSAIDPICGMSVEIRNAISKGLVSDKNGKKYYFCSKSCKDKFDNKKFSFEKVFPIILGIVLVTFTVISVLFDFMLLYMGIFFIVFSIFKMPDWSGFITAYKQYDLLAKIIPGYSAVYPAIELIIGILFLVNHYTSFYLIPIAVFTLAIMSIGALGVAIKLSKNEKFQCACLGTWLKIPLTKVTLLEDLLMAGMALLILFE